MWFLHLRPIFLTPAISKIAEDFVVSIHVGPAVLKVDSDQFAAIPNSSTVQTLMSMLHHWTKANKKAFDLIDHHLLVRKIYSLSIPPWCGTLGDWLPHESETACKALLGLFLWVGTGTIQGPTGNQIGSMVVFADDQWFQNSWCTYLEICGRHHDCWNCTKGWSQWCPTRRNCCWRLVAR